MITTNEIIGVKYGRLTIIQDLGTRKPKYKRYVLAQCTCGIKREFMLGRLRTGHTKSCGCWNIEMMVQRATRHGLVKHPLYSVWLGLKKRCYSDKEKSYPDYGGRGITVCDEWLNDFTAFYEWALENGYAKGLEIDRRNNSGNYEPGNCRFVPRIINAGNRRSNRLITFNGQTLIMADWAKELGMRYDKIRYRMNAKWPIDKVLNPAL